MKNIFSQQIIFIIIIHHHQIFMQPIDYPILSRFSINDQTIQIRFIEKLNKKNKEEKKQLNINKSYERGGGKYSLVH